MNWLSGKDCRFGLNFASVHGGLDRFAQKNYAIRRKDDKIFFDYLLNTSGKPLLFGFQDL